MVPAVPGNDPGTGGERTPDATEAQSGDRDEEWRRVQGALRAAWGPRDVGKVAVALAVGALVVWVPYVLFVSWATSALVASVDVGPTLLRGAVVFVTLTTFTSFMFSAVVLVDWLLPWESPLSLR
jgi:hypothetical protein